MSSMSPYQKLVHDFRQWQYKEIAKQVMGADRLLEIGFGEGAGTEVLAVAARSVMAIDNSIERVRSVDSHNVNIQFKLVDGTDLWKEWEKRFDAVVCVHLIEHIEDDFDFVSGVHRVLKVGGKAFFMTPNRNAWLEPWEKPWNPQHVREYSGYSLWRLLRAPKFSNVHLYGADMDGKAKALYLRRNMEAKRLSQLDPWRLRRFLPAEAIHKASLFVERHMLKKHQKPDIRPEFRMREDYDNALDLVAVATR